MIQIPEMNIEQHQIALLSKLKMGYDLCVKNPTITCNPIYFFNTSKEEQEKFLLYDTKSESYRMRALNYLIELIGYEKNDKYSIFHYPPKGQEKIINDFIEENKSVIEKIYKTRNKIYSHFDIDFEKETQRIEFEEIKRIIDFIESVLIKK